MKRTSLVLIRRRGRGPALRRRRAEGSRALPPACAGQPFAAAAAQSSRWSSIFASIMPWQAPQSPPARQTPRDGLACRRAIRDDGIDLGFRDGHANAHVHAVLKIMKPVFIIKVDRGAKPPCLNKMQRGHAHLARSLKGITSPVIPRRSDRKPADPVRSAPAVARATRGSAAPGSGPRRPASRARAGPRASRRAAPRRRGCPRAARRCRCRRPGGTARSTC